MKNYIIETANNLGFIIDGKIFSIKDGKFSVDIIVDQNPIPLNFDDTCSLIIKFYSGVIIIKRETHKDVNINFVCSQMHRAKFFIDNLNQSKEISL